MESSWILPASVAFVVVFLLFRARQLRTRNGAVVVVLLIFAIVTAIGRSSGRERRSDSLKELARITPAEREDSEFVSSSTCKSCHPGDYASWHRTYHRSMTQLAVPGNVLGDFDDARVIFPADEDLVFPECTYEMTRRGDEYWVGMVDPRAGEEWVERRVALTTGSHHIQAYWVEGTHPGELVNVPVVWLIDDQRWVPRGSVLLTRKNRGVSAPWNVGCISCHVTGGQPGIDRWKREFSTKAAELGISCESCHGPGREHVEANQDPRRRYRLRGSGEGDPTIVNPARLSPQRSSEVCGQCHASMAFKDDREQELWTRVGYRYRAGDPLTRQGVMIRPQLADSDPWTKKWLSSSAIQAEIPHRFWSDGIIRVAGLNYSAMLESACNQGHQLSCLSCHSMHDADPNDLLAEDMHGNEACFQCHDQYRQNVESHTHHPAGSSGSTCYNCHMPHITWGLMGAIRTHWIHSPNVQSSLEVGRPNACNLCHLDQTLEWTAEHLHEWYGLEVPELPAEHREVAAVPLWLLKGDAGLRGLSSWHMGWGPAHEASGSGWEAPLLSYLLIDPYEVVRFRAHKSLLSLPGFGDIEFDFVGTAEHRREAARKARERWFARTKAGDLDRTGAAILIDPRSGELMVGTVEELLAQRDDRRVSLNE